MVRHGETEGQSSVRYYGRTDVRLSDAGRAQMRAAARALSKFEFTAVFSSWLSRAVEAAEIISGSASAKRIRQFAEIDFGLFEGLTSEEIRARYPEEFERWQAWPLEDDYCYPQGESRRDFAARIRSGLDLMMRQWRGESEMPIGDALLVAHRGVIRMVGRQLLDVDLIAELGSIQILEIDKGRWRCAEKDLTDHLATHQ